MFYSLVIIIVLLMLLLITVGYFCIKFALIIINMQEVIEESLDIIDEKYSALSKILEIPIFYNNTEVKRAILELEDTKDALLYIANQLTNNNNLEEEDKFEEESINN